MRDSIGTNVEEMDLHWGEGGGKKRERIGGGGRRGKTVDFLYSANLHSTSCQISMSVSVITKLCNNKECLKNLLM